MPNTIQMPRKCFWLLWVLFVVSACGSAATSQTTTAVANDVASGVNTDAQVEQDAAAGSSESLPDGTAPAIAEPPDPLTQDNAPAETVPEVVPQTTAPPATVPPTTEPATAVSPTTAPPATAPPATVPPTTVPELPQPVSRPPFTCDDPCNVVIEGDSLTRGLVNRLCNRVTDLGNCHNSGVPGDRTDQMLASAPADVDAQVGNSNNDLLFLWAGTNDLWLRFHSVDPVTNAAATAANIETYISERRAAGWDHIVLVNLPPMMSAVTGVDELNALLPNIDADTHIDLNADPEVALGNDNGFRDPDGVHFSREGYTYLTDTYYIPTVSELRS